MKILIACFLRRIVEPVFLFLFEIFENLAFSIISQDFISNFPKMRRQTKLYNWNRESPSCNPGTLPSRRTGNGSRLHMDNLLDIHRCRGIFARLRWIRRCKDRKKAGQLLSFWCSSLTPAWTHGCIACSTYCQSQVLCNCTLHDRSHHIHFRTIQSKDIFRNNLKILFEKWGFERLSYLCILKDTLARTLRIHNHSCRLKTWRNNRRHTVTPNPRLYIFWYTKLLYIDFCI